MKIDLFLTKHMYGDSNNYQFFMSKHENIYIKHVFDFRTTKHINTNHDNILSFDFIFRNLEKEKYYHINFYNYLLFRISEKSYCYQL